MNIFNVGIVPMQTPTNVRSETATDPTPPCGDPALNVGTGDVAETPGENLLVYAQELIRESRRMKEEITRLDSLVMLKILQSLARIEAKLDAQRH